MIDLERRNNVDISFHEDEVKLAKTMMDKLRTTFEFLYYLMEYRGKVSFAMITIAADNLNLNLPLQKWKRQTDVLIEIDPIQNVYVIICQSTDLEGGKKFAEILISNINMNGGEAAYCVETELTSTKHSIQEVIFKMAEKYITIKQNEKSNEVHLAHFGEEVTEDEDIAYFKELIK